MRRVVDGRSQPRAGVLPSLVAVAIPHGAALAAGAEREISGHERQGRPVRATQTVFGEGPAHAPLVLVGEQPGETEDRAGHPFVGRRGEVLGPTSEDVDLDEGSVTIRSSLSQTKSSVVLKSTKTDRIRSVPISETTCAAFRKQRAQQAADKLHAGEAYNADPTGPIFTDELGNRLSPKAATNAFARLAKKAGISTISLHSTRHTTATTLVRAGVDLRTVSSIMGHSNASVTLTIYSHVVEGAERAAVALLERGIGDAIKR